MTPDQIATLSVLDLDAAVIEKCKALRELEGWASRNWRPEHGEAGPGALICTGLDGGSYWLFAYHGGLPGPGIDLQFRFAHDRKLATAARNSFLAHLDAMEALAGWRCGACNNKGIKLLGMCQVTWPLNGKHTDPHCGRPAQQIAKSIGDGRGDEYNVCISHAEDVAAKLHTLWELRGPDPCPSCAPIVTIKREWLGKMEALG